VGTASLTSSETARQDVPVSGKKPRWRQRRLALTLLAGATLIVSVSSCGEQATSSGTPQGRPSSTLPVEVLQSELDRSESSAPDTDVAQATQAGSRFGLDLFKSARSAEENIALSPYSLSIALAMTLAGARGDTEQEMLQALSLTLSPERLHPALNSLSLDLQEAADTSQRRDVKLRLHQVGSLWGQRGQTYQTDFLDLLARDYGAGLHLLDNLSSEEARLAINDWAKGETSGRIPELLSPGALTRPDPIYLVLANTLTLSAPWKWPFPWENTSPGVFHLLDGTEREVPMMRQAMPFPYQEGADYQAIELPYVGQKFGMVILLPGEGKFEEFMRGLDEERLQEIVAGLREDELMPLTLPRFSVEWRSPLKQLLQGLGMQLSFDQDAADFSGMNGSGGIWVDEVYHAARITVDEVGTEAAAGSAVVMAAGIGQREMVVDRPFVFLIRHRETGAMLFLGQVVDPVSP